MTDHRPSPTDPAADAGPAEPVDAVQEGAAALRLELATTRKELRQLGSRVSVMDDRMLGLMRVLVRSSAFLAAATMLLGSLMKFFIPVSGDDRSLTLYQVLDAEKEPDLMDDSSWGTGTGWLIPIAMVVICAVLVVCVGGTASPASAGTALITVTEVFCWCLSIGCLLGFAVLADLRNIVAVPGALLTILLGGALGIVSCRLARAHAD